LHQLCDSILTAGECGAILSFILVEKVFEKSDGLAEVVRFEGGGLRVVVLAGRGRVVVAENGLGRV
jgi:hypothetical protein